MNSFDVAARGTCGKYLVGLDPQGKMLSDEYVVKHPNQLCSQLFLPQVVATLYNNRKQI